MSAGTNQCRYCGGTGKVVLMKSWFITDGFRKERCGVCDGSGVSTYCPPADWISSQGRLRAALNPSAASASDAKALASKGGENG